MNSGAQQPPPDWRFPSNPVSGWAQVGYIKASNPSEGDQFGFSVALSGDGKTLAVGATQESSGSGGINGNQADDSEFASGAVYVFTRTGIGWGWKQQAYIKATHPRATDQFGFAVALSGDGNTLVVSAPYEKSGATGINGDPTDDSAPESGAVYVFTRDGETWSQQAYVKASNTDESDTFGFTIALSDDGRTLAVGAPAESSAPWADESDDSLVGAGAVYVFTRNGDAWSQQGFIKSMTPFEAPARGELFGYALGLSADGSRMAIGIYEERGCANFVDGPFIPGCGGSGAVYVMARDGDTWTREAYLKPATRTNQDSIGAWVGISDDGKTVAAGALDEDSLTTGINAVVADNQRLNTSTGAAYVFVESQPRWVEQANFKASNTGVEDWFGIRLALSGDGNTLAVGAPNEDGSSRGINGDQQTRTADQSGAVYVFKRENGTWTQEAYVKASNADEYHEFGSSVALSSDGRTMAVGARFEASSATGFYGNQHDSSLPGAGAVYVFVRDPFEIPSPTAQ